MQITNTAKRGIELRIDFGFDEINVIDFQACVSLTLF